MPKLYARDGTPFIVDAEDFSLAEAHTWTYQAFRGKKRLVRWEAIPPEQRKTTTSHRLVFLHREILGVTDPFAWIGFRDENPLNCTRANLVRLEPAEVLAHRKPGTRVLRARGVSSYLGVSWHKARQQWRAVVRIDGRLRWLGQFGGDAEGETRAAIAYDKAVLLHGLDRPLNFPGRRRRRPKGTPSRTERKPRQPVQDAPSSTPGEIPIGDLYAKPITELSAAERMRMKGAFLRSQ